MTKKYKVNYLKGEDEEEEWVSALLCKEMKFNK